MTDRKSTDGISRRTVLKIVAGAAVAAPSLVHAAGDDAASYPEKRIRIVVPFAPGATMDLLGRLIGQELEAEWGQSVTVENIPGAGGITGTANAARSAPDGYTLVLVPSSHVILPSIMSDIPFDYKKDFEPVSLIATSPSLFIFSNDFAPKTFPEFIDLARTKDIKYGSSGTGTVNHIGAERFKEAAGVKLSHVPYKGGGAAMNDIMGGHLDMTLGALSGSYGYCRDGKARALAVTSKERHPMMPDVPSLTELGYPIEWNEWFGILAPAGTPPAIIEKINTALVKRLKNPEFAAKVPANQLKLSSPQEFATFMDEEAKTWGDAARRMNIKIN